MAIKIVYSKDLKGSASTNPPKHKSGGIKALADQVRGSVKEANGAIRAKGSDAMGVKIVVDSEGQRHRLRILDARSDSFGEDFAHAFSQNVKKARKENTRLIGQPDVAIKQ